MTANDSNDRARRERRKYKTVTVASLAGLALAAGVFVLAYQQHVELMNDGNEVGQRLQSLDMIGKGDAHAER